MDRRALTLGLCLVLGFVGLGAAPAAARPFTVDDLLQQEGFGRVVVDPGGRFAVIERREPYDTAARFDGQHRIPLATSRLLISDLAAADPTARPLMPQPAGYGYLAGPWAPDGDALAVLRLADGGWELGVARPHTQAVQWLGLTPASNMRGESILWRSARQLLVLARPADDPPWELRLGSQSARRLPPRWAAAAAGEPAISVIGSGAYLQVAPRPAATLLIQIDLRDGTRRVLASGAFTDMSLAPDGRSLALLETGERLQPAPDRPPQGPWGTATEATRLAMLDLRTETLTRPCASCDLLNTLLSWSPSGKQLLVFARRPDAPWTAGALHLYRPRTGRLEALPHPTLAPAFRYRPERVETGWFGEQPLVHARRAGQEVASPPASQDASRGASQPAKEDGGRADWWRLDAAGPHNLTSGLPQVPTAIRVGRRELQVLAGDRLWSVARTGSVRVVADGVTRIPYPFVAPQQRLSYVASDRPEHLLLRTREGELRLGDGRPVATAVKAAATAVAFGTAQDALVAVRTSPNGEAVLERYTPGAAPQAIATINASYRDTDAPVIREIRHAGPAGEPLKSWLYLPAGADRDPQAAGAPPPLVIWPYLGDTHPAPPAEKPAILNLAVNPRVLTGHGYAVLIPSLPLPMSAREPFAGVAARLLGIVDAAAAQAPHSFDPDRLALWGHSYGGYTTLAAISQSDRFKAAIAMAPPTDLISHAGNFQVSHRVSPQDGVGPAWLAGFAENSQGRMGAPPWRDPMRYVRNSPIFHAEAITTPVLLIHGDQDAIEISQSEEMFSALFRLRRDAMLVTYWGEGHIIASPGNVRDLYARAFRWLDRYLAPSGPRPRGVESGT